MSSQYSDSDRWPMPERPTTYEEYAELSDYLHDSPHPEINPGVTGERAEAWQPRIMGALYVLQYAKGRREHEDAPSAEELLEERTAAEELFFDENSNYAQNLAACADLQQNVEFAKQSVEVSGRLLGFAKTMISTIEAPKNEKADNVDDAESILVSAVSLRERMRHPFDLELDTKPEPFIRDVTKTLELSGVSDENGNRTRKMLENFISHGIVLVDHGAHNDDTVFLSQGLTLLDAAAVLGTEQDKSYVKTTLGENVFEEIFEAQMAGKLALLGMHDFGDGQLN